MDLFFYFSNYLDKKKIYINHYNLQGGKIGER